MKLRSLRLHGFKSFPDPTRIEFHDGITAVVGPNGCGKSNVGDAIRWVLGEQRPTAIRGAKMEEAIFQGTVARKPVNRGSVSMVVSNEDGVLPTPFEEVEISRTVYRDGGSDYRLNRTACRLRDIVDLCRDTGLGANAYSVIEIRMIDAILSERTDERRSLFEEAAGIGKYKDRRRAALRRLETSEVDLQRVEDVIAEVRTKVRSLARQKGKAQRYQELRARRLAVEVAVVRFDLEALEAELTRVDAELAQGTEEGAGAAAQLGAAEAGLEAARLAQVGAEKGRGEAATRFDSVRSELARVETEVAVAGERMAAAERRFDQIGGDAKGLERLRTRSADELTELREDLSQREANIEVARSNFTERSNNVTQVRERLEAARESVRELEESARAVARRIAQAEGDRESARVQADELGRRLERLSRSSKEGDGTLEELQAQGDLFANRQTELAAKASEAARAFDEARRQMEGLRERMRAARSAETDAEPQAAALEAEAQALRAALRSGEGSEALAAEALDALPDDVDGLLSDFVKVTGGPGKASAQAVDALLGRFGCALVVPNADAVERVCDWYDARTDDARPTLVLLPLDRVPDGSPGAFPDGVSATGAGAPWVRALLGGIAAGRNEGQGAAQAARWTDPRGAVHLVADRAGGGRLERRERLAELERAADEARRGLAGAKEARERLEGEVARSESQADAASERLLEARDEARAAESEALAHDDRRQRLARHQEEVARQLEAGRAARDRAVERERNAVEERARRVEEEGALSGRLNDRRTALAAVEAEWEQARDAEAEAAIRAARTESEAERVRARLSDVTQAVERAEAGLADLRQEAAGLDEELTTLRKSAGDGSEALNRLATERDQARELLSQRDETLQSAAEAALEAEHRVRKIRSAEREAADHRHRLELARQDVANQAERVRDRLESEWGRPLEALLAEAGPAKGDPEELRAELAEIASGLERIGPVNMLAVEEHAEERARLDFLAKQREDLVAARDDLRAAIRQINATATELFMTSFEAIKENFRRTFQHLFSGGEADLWLADPENPLESPVEIHAAPGGKRTQRIDLLSGGERALTALSLLFGIYLVKPSPFCVLDEVDAPLDESNIGRFIRLLQGFKSDTQFVVVTHNPRTIEAADWIYGVTMQEPGVSSVVGVRLDGQETAA